MILPNGKILEKEKLQELEMLGKQFNIQEARIIGDSEYNLQLVENMKETLFSVYGNEARDFFGEIRTENYSIVEPDSPRYLSLPTSNDNIICYEKTTLTEHWESGGIILH